MAATTEQIARLRRMVGEPTPNTYDDAALAAYIERFPCLDERGEEPYTWLVSNPPTQYANPEWIPTYDLNAAAAEIWAEKAALLSSNYDFSADGASHTRSQAYENAMKQSRYYAARRRPSVLGAHVSPAPNGTTSYVGNTPESDD